MTAVELPADVTIGRASRADIDAVSRLEREVFPQPWPADAFWQYVDEPGFLVARVDRSNRWLTDGTPAPEDADVVGYVVANVVSQYGVDIGHVKDLAVAAEYRRSGVGTALLDRALSVLAQRGVRRVKLEVREGNDAARGLYDRFGFQLSRRLPGYYADGEDALVFVTVLDG